MSRDLRKLSLARLHRILSDTLRVAGEGAESVAILRSAIREKESRVASPARRRRRAAKEAARA